MFCQPRDGISSRGVRHHEVQGLLAAYAAGTLAEADAERVRAHLASGCLECLADVFARPVGLPRDLPIAHEPAARPGSSWRAWLAGIALLAGVAGAALVLGRGDAGEQRPPRAESSTSTAPATAESSTSTVAPPVETSTSSPAAGSDAAPPAPSSTLAPAADAPALDPERARLLALLAAERTQLDERTRELEAAAERARAAEAESAEQATALAALDSELAAAKRHADDLDRRLRDAERPTPRTRTGTAVESVLAAPDARLLPLRAVGRFRDVRGHAVWHPGSDAVVVYGFGLPRLPNGRTYHVRVDVGSGEAITIPRLRPDASGRVVVPLRLPPGAHAVTGVRIARDPGGDAVLAGRAPAGTAR